MTAGYLIELTNRPAMTKQKAEATKTLAYAGTISRTQSGLEFSIPLYLETLRIKC